MDPRAWSSDRTLPLDRAVRAISTHFPQFRGALPRVLGEGWDHEVFELARTWVFRFPKRRDVQPALVRERAVLTRLRTVLPTSVPDFKYVGWPSEFFPYLYAGYVKLSGESLQDHATASLSKRGERRLARELGEFLSALHAVKLCSLGISLPRLAEAILEPRRAVGRWLPHLEAEDRPLAHRLERHLAKTASCSPTSNLAVLTHGDLGTDHILVDPERESLTAVIDWGDVKAAPAASDFAGLYGFGGLAFLERVLEHYRGPVGWGDLPWIASRAIYEALRSVIYGRLAHKPAYVASGLDGIRRVLSHPPP